MITIATYSLTPVDLLRFVCGFFFIPHAIGKFTAQEASFNFFRAAGFKPAAPFAFAAMGIEVVLAALLLLGYQVNVAAWISAAYLLIAAAATLKVTKKWLWHIGGCEYPLFWALCCVVLAMMA